MVSSIIRRVHISGNTNFRFFNSIIKPYFAIGLGALNFEPTTTVGGTATTQDSQTKLFVPADFGLKFAISKGVNLDLGYQLNWANQDFDGGTGGTYKNDLFLLMLTQIETQEIAEALIKDGYNADSLHGDLSQQQRDKVMKRYRDRSLQLLIATDVAARGIDVNDLTIVKSTSPSHEVRELHTSFRPIPGLLLKNAPDLNMKHVTTTAVNAADRREDRSRVDEFTRWNSWIYLQQTLRSPDEEVEKVFLRIPELDFNDVNVRIEVSAKQKRKAVLAEEVVVETVVEDVKADIVVANAEAVLKDVIVVMEEMAVASVIFPENAKNPKANIN
ncbi:hypothetical protein FQR65_LT18694 [Abscondita terminalis]|nr:hypothetical protein FQR65_LT18694 [Abscondita terminalis]